jgi:malonyl-CoA O-methyltransferase
MDWSPPMLARAGVQRGWLRRRFERVAADASALPLADSSVDLLYSNLMLQWCDDLPAMLNGFRRILKPGGLVLLSTFGPDTLTELREAWRSVDEQPHVSPFADVQTIGDSMMRAGFGEPVLDTDWITTTYTKPRALLDELKAIGATYAGSERQRGLTTPRRLRLLLAAYENARLASGLYPATWEVVYASAWGPEEGAPIRNIHGEEASVSVASIGRRKR